MWGRFQGRALLGAVVTRAVAEVPRATPVTAHERPAQSSCCLLHVRTVEGSLEAWVEASGLSLYLSCKFAGQGAVRQEDEELSSERA